jgi:polyhydroxyalkanoate synthesis regulator phasin
MANEQPFLIVENTEENIKKILNSEEATPQGKVVNLPERVTELENEVTELENEVTELEDKVKELEKTTPGGGGDVSEEEIERIVLELLNGVILNGGTAAD